VTASASEPERGTRPCYLAANWKMHKTVAEAAAFVDALLPRIAASRHDIVLCPPFLALAEVVERSRGSALRVAAQNMHEEEAGAFTGEVSAQMLRDVEVDAVVLGHSERRQLFGETDAALVRKVPAALAAGLEPILCVGESEEARDAGQTEAVLEAQLQADLAAVEGTELAAVVIAYEPIWAIGTGRTATPDQAEEAIAFIRDVLRQRGAAAEEARILYGGSVKPGNAGELLGRAEIDGALVGGASLDAEDFAAIVKAAG
jgi:triosephosphate isomerase (TIM)